MHRSTRGCAHAHSRRACLLRSQDEGADKCAEAIVWMLNTLVGPDPKTSKSRYRELPRSKQAWKVRDHIPLHAHVWESCPPRSPALFDAAAPLLPSLSQAYLSAIFETCHEPGKSDPPAAQAAYQKCRASAASALVQAGSGNSVLKLTTPISVSWTTFFE